MKNKRLIIIFSVFVFIVLIVVVSSAFFSLQKTVLLFKNEFDEFVDEDLSSHQGFDLNRTVNGFKGKSILFLDRKKLTETIEKEYLWLSVLGVEAVFPSTVKVTATVRVPVFHFESKGVSYTCDAEGFVMSATAVSGTIKVTSSRLASQNVTVGTYLNSGDALVAKDIIISLWRQTDEEYKFSTIPFFINSLVFLNDELTVNTAPGGKMIIYKPETDTFEKFVSVYGLFKARPDKQINGVFKTGYYKNSQGIYQSVVEE